MYKLKSHKEDRLMHATKNDLPLDVREKELRLLNERLVNAIDLMLQAKQAHWNVKGPEFISLHELFDRVNKRARKSADLIAERAVQLGGTVDGTCGTVARETTLPGYPTTITDGREHVTALSSSLAVFGKQVRSAIDQADQLHDKDTADIFTQISRDIDMLLWFVEAHNQAER